MFPLNAVAAAFNTYIVSVPFLATARRKKITTMFTIKVNYSELTPAINRSQTEEY
jgi:hypothetical protein